MTVNKILKHPDHNHQRKLTSKSALGSDCGGNGGGSQKRLGRFGPRVFFEVREGSDLGRSFGHGLLDWLIGIACQADIHFAKLRCFSNPGIVGLLGVLRLNLESLL